MTTLHAIQEQLTGHDKSVELIGHQVFWSLSEDSAVDYATLKQVAVDSGFDAKSYQEGGVLPRETTPCSAWTRAIADFKKDEKFRSLGLVTDSENIPADREAKVAAKGLLTVHNKQVDSGAAQVGFQQQMAIEFDKSATADQPATQVIRLVNGSGEMANSVYQWICYYYSQNLNRVNINDVRTTIKRILHLVRAFSMRPSGGIYFVPVKFTATVEALSKFVSSLKGSVLYALDLPKVSVRTVETVRQTACEAMESELEQLKKDIDTGLNSATLQKNGEDSSTHARLIELINDYRARAEFYADYLTGQTSDITKTVADLEQKIMQAVAV